MVLTNAPKYIKITVYVHNKLLHVSATGSVLGPMYYSLCIDLVQLSYCEISFLWLVIDNSCEVNLCKLQMYFA